LENAILLPLCLVFLLDCNKSISFLCLYSQNHGQIAQMFENRGVLTPFNSLVLEIVALSKAFAVASTAAMI
jgi:hypothetical protein